MPLSQQRDEDLRWIREPFLTHTTAFDRYVVHGHTPTLARRPDMRANRLNLDTGAGYGGPVTAAIFTGETCKPVGFLSEPLI